MHELGREAPARLLALSGLAPLRKAFGQARAPRGVQTALKAGEDVGLRREVIGQPRDCIGHFLEVPAEASAAEIRQMPRARGTRQGAEELVARLRIIPACAGNRRWRRSRRSRVPDHPRVRGEQPSHCRRSVQHAGSSTRARGTIQSNPRNVRPCLKADVFWASPASGSSWFSPSPDRRLFVENTWAGLDVAKRCGRNTPSAQR